jgi:hypothetical protein
MLGFIFYRFIKVYDTRARLNIISLLNWQVSNFRAITKGYLDGIKENLELMPIHYPGANVMKLFTALSYDCS